VTEDFAADYRSALDEHLQVGDESSLEQAHELGRRALTVGLSVLDVVLEHERAIVSAADRRGDPIEKLRTAALPFLLQSLAALDMATRGFVEAAERVTIEQAHVAQLQRLAQWFSGAYVDLLADQRLRRMTAWLREVMDATGAYIQFGGADARSGLAHSVPVSLAELLQQEPASATARGTAADETSGQWLAARLEVHHDDERASTGVLVVWRAGEFTPFDEAVLAQFGKLASAALRNAELYRREHDIAVTLQSSLMPKSALSTAELTVSARYEPSGLSSRVGGDWFDVISLPGQRVGLVVGDVMGHGISAAALMGHVSVAVRAYAVEGHDPATVVTRVDELISLGGDKRLATLIYAIIGPDGTLQFANAGHPPPLIVPAGGEPAYLTQALSQPIGVRAAGTPHHDHITTLSPGTTVLLYTDGLIEQRGRSIDEGLDALRRLAAAEASSSLDALCDAALATLVPQPAPDDACILAARRRHLS
jgi:serine phosphatase RsbU (regulator of sigma subunit)